MSGAFYDCGEEPLADPNGIYSYGCDGSDAPETPNETDDNPELPVEEEAETVEESDSLCSAAGLPTQGCCTGATLTYCKDGKLLTHQCADSCGWDAIDALYNCGLPENADPSGEFPLSCEEAGIITELVPEADFLEDDEDSNGAKAEDDSTTFESNEETEEVQELPTGSTTRKEQDEEPEPSITLDESDAGVPEESRTSVVEEQTSEEIVEPDGAEAVTSASSHPSYGWSPAPQYSGEESQQPGFAAEGGCSTSGHLTPLGFLLWILLAIPVFRFRREN